jgi:hypothetical protein
MLRKIKMLLIYQHVIQNETVYRSYMAYSNGVRYRRTECCPVLRVRTLNNTMVIDTLECNGLFPHQLGPQTLISNLVNHFSRAFGEKVNLTRNHSQTVHAGQYRILSRAIFCDDSQ